jgi:hypothetical protein
MTTNPSLLQTMSAAVELHRAHQRVTAAAPPDAVPSAWLRKRRPAAWLPNNAGGSAPPLTLLKRKETPMASFNDLIASVDALIKAGDYDGAEHALARADSMVNKARSRAVQDDEDDFESPSDPSNDYDGDDDDDDEEDGVRVKKASEHYSYHGYGGTPSPATPASYGTGPNQKSDTYATGSWPTTGAPSKTEFDGKVDMVMERDGTSRHIAMATARNEFPREFTDHQNSLSEGPTRNQHARRSSAQATKAAPTFYEDLVAEQMAKGCNEEMAKVRVAQLHGYDAQRMPSLMRKGADLGDRFQRIVKRLAFENDISMEDATRLARHRNPSLYKAMNSI